VIEADLDCLHQGQYDIVDCSMVCAGDVPLWMGHFGRGEDENEIVDTLVRGQSGVEDGCKGFMIVQIKLREA